MGVWGWGVGVWGHGGMGMKGGRHGDGDWDMGMGTWGLGRGYGDMGIGMGTWELGWGLWGWDKDGDVGIKKYGDWERMEVWGWEDGDYGDYWDRGTEVEMWGLGKDGGVGLGIWGWGEGNMGV